MRLHNEPFNYIKTGTKTIEMRLYDDKRRLIKIGDIIEFSNRVTDEKLDAKVVNLYTFNNFNELYKNFNKVCLGYNEDEVANPNDMNQYYSKVEQDKYGVIAIEIEKQ
ncbi:MAG: ASCH domain-containing protein [Bacilli bacterium]|nr:ASCH domain-containing protein [Bacilli bacterium]